VIESEFYEQMMEVIRNSSPTEKQLDVNVDDDLSQYVDSFTFVKMMIVIDQVSGGKLAIEELDVDNGLTLRKLYWLYKGLKSDLYD
jgi:hypothetical protein